MNNSSHKDSTGSSSDSSASVQQQCDLHIEERGKFNLEREVCITATDEPLKAVNGLPNVKSGYASPDNFVESSGAKKPDFEFNVSITDIFPSKVIQDDFKEAEPSLENEIDMQGIEVEPRKKQQQTTKSCLVSEMSGSHYRRLLSDPTGGSQISNPIVSRDTLKAKRLAANKLTSSKLSSLHTGIGLNLNALPDAGKELIVNTPNQDPTCGIKLTSSPSIASSLNENPCEKSSIGEGIVFLQNSPVKKRKETDGVGETYPCKQCNCKRSMCLKLYCECFTAGAYCVGSCNCQDCFNKPSHEDTVLETRRQIELRNPLAFAPKVIICSGTPTSGNKLNQTRASARYKRGCSYKKSSCLKKYCECFQARVGCSLSCRCEACKNTFGLKEGIEVVFEEAKILRECSTDVSSLVEVPKIDHENPAAHEHSNKTRSAD